jgi:hypothetical protein
VLNTIRQSWGWTGLDPMAIVGVNEFGNIVVRAADNAFWRICPEELSCERIARTESEFDALWQSDEFQHDWQMTRLVEIAAAKLGPAGPDRCYCMKLSPVFGGAYAADNFGTITHEELLDFSGYVARQISGLPDGAKVIFRVRRGDG